MAAVAAAVGGGWWLWVSVQCLLLLYLGYTDVPLSWCWQIALASVDETQQDHGHMVFCHLRVCTEQRGVILGCETQKYWCASAPCFCVIGSVLKENILTAVSVLIPFGAAVNKGIKRVGWGGNFCQYKHAIRRIKEKKSVSLKKNNDLLTLR